MKKILILSILFLSVKLFSGYKQTWKIEYSTITEKSTFTAVGYFNIGSDTKTASIFMNGITGEITGNRITVSTVSAVGRIGIGTKTPEERLHIQELNKDAWLLIDTLSDNLSQFELRNHDADGSWRWVFSARASAEDHKLKITQYNPIEGTWKPKIHINTDGSIETVSGNIKANGSIETVNGDIKANDTQPDLIANITDSTLYGRILFMDNGVLFATFQGIGDSFTDAARRHNLEFFATPQGNDIAFFTNGNNKRMRITKNGLIEIYNLVDLQAGAQSEGNITVSSGKTVDNRDVSKTIMDKDGNEKVNEYIIRGSVYCPVGISTTTISIVNAIQIPSVNITAKGKIRNDIYLYEVYNSSFSIVNENLTQGTTVYYIATVEQ